jgi:hypothetical protein
VFFCCRLGTATTGSFFAKVMHSSQREREDALEGQRQQQQDDEDEDDDEEESDKPAGLTLQPASSSSSSASADGMGSSSSSRGSSPLPLLSARSEELFPDGETEGGNKTLLLLFVVAQFLS